MDKEWEILDHSVEFEGFFRMEKYTLRHTLFDGGWSPPLVREIFERGHAAAVLPYDPQREELLLVEQFRAGAIHHREGPWLLELIAGIIEPGENAEAVVRREAVEEAGCHLQQVVPVFEYLVSPGGTTEQISLFCAHADLEGREGVHGLADEGEDILVHVYPVDEALALLHGGHIHNAMTLIALQWLEHERARLRHQWVDLA